MTASDTRPYEDSVVRDARTRDAALGPGIENLNVDTADRRILLQILDQADQEIDEALGDVARLEKELADTRAKLAAATRAAATGAAKHAWDEMMPPDVRRALLVQQIQEIDKEAAS